MARKVLLDLIRRVIRPALRWLYHKRIPNTEGQAENKWVEQEATESAGLLLSWLLQDCECYRHARKLTTNSALALTRCRTLHRLSRWQGDESLCRFLCRALVCLHKYYWPRMDHFTNLTDYCPKELAVNEFRKGMLAKAVLAGDLRCGYVLRCIMTPDCPGEIDPTTDCCTSCRRLTEHRTPKHFWLWVGEQYGGPKDCLLCRTCRYYYFQHQRPCPREKPAEGAHHWSRSKPFKAWVRIRSRGGNWLTYEAASEIPAPGVALTSEGRRQFQEAIDAIPADPQHDLAAELQAIRKEISLISRLSCHF